MIPPFESVRCEEHYYGTVLHELCHWTEHETRLNRDFKNRFGTRSRAWQGISLRSSWRKRGNAARILLDSWLTLLRDDDRAIFTAASKASAAADYLRAFSETVEDAA
jgi:antirestriction protein ArdC